MKALCKCRRVAMLTGGGNRLAPDDRIPGLVPVLGAGPLDEVAHFAPSFFDLQNFFMFSKHELHTSVLMGLSMIPFIMVILFPNKRPEQPNGSFSVLISHPQMSQMYFVTVSTIVYLLSFEISFRDNLQDRDAILCGSLHEYPSYLQ
jgi:hypothetical protein